MRVLKAAFALAFAFSSFTAFGQAPSAPPSSPQQGTAQSKKPAAEKPTTPEQSPKPETDQTSRPAAQQPPQKPGFRLSNLDRSVDPCVDFYQFACGGWMKNNPIPSDQASWDSFSSVYVENQNTLHDILEKAAKPAANRGAVDREIGDFYYACTDQKTVDQKGLAAIKPELDRINAIKDKAEMIDVIAHIHLTGPNPLFDFGQQPDYHDASQSIGAFDQAGLSMPDRDYYLKDEPKYAAVKTAFIEYMNTVFKLAGQSPEQAKQSAQTVLNIETDLARAFMPRVDRRNPKNLDHKMTVQELAASAPNFQITRYLRAVGAPAFTSMNVRNPDYFKQTNATIEKYPLDAWKTYLTWQRINGIARWLSDPFVEARFKYDQSRTGQKELQTRWKRCVDLTDDSLGEALGQPYVQETFGAQGKARMLTMVNALEQALDSDIRDLDWMSADTKKAAKAKLDAIRNKIGYPEKWRDYSSIKIVRDDLAGNVMRATEFEARRQQNKIGKPVDKAEWGMTPPTVNAYYSGLLNEIVFPAGILQPPFFDRSLDDAMNFGSIGAVIGHELTHGFDDQGRKFDPQGNLRDWWTPQDGAEFEKRASCIADEYSSFTAVDDLKLNGRLTLGENTADNGGARIALMALLAHMQQGKTTKGGGAEPAAAAQSQSGQNQSSENLNAFTPEQRFFLGFASVWCENRTPEISKMLVTVDPHSPGRWRTNGVVQNMPEFQKAWNCKAGQPMVRANACHVW